MTSYIRLIKSDWKIIGRDPMLLVSYMAPFLILGVVLFLFPYVSGLTDRYFQFPLDAWFSFGYIFFLPIVSMLIGMVYGFILLDERDAGLISYLSITPLGKIGYISVRMLIPTVVSLLFSLGYLLLTGFQETLNPFEIILLSLIIATEAPMMILFLGAFAGNKVEGIAISKGFGILLLAMIVDYFFKGGWRWLLSVCPLWWIERAALLDHHTGLYLAGAACTHFVFIFLLFRKFNNRFG